MKSNFSNDEFKIPDDYKQPDPCYIKKCIKCKQEYLGKDNAWYGLCPDCNKEIEKFLEKDRNKEINTTRCLICDQDFINKTNINTKICPECIKKYDIK